MPSLSLRHDAYFAIIYLLFAGLSVLHHQLLPGMLCFWPSRDQCCKSTYSVSYKMCSDNVVCSMFQESLCMLCMNYITVCNQYIV